MPTISAAIEIAIAHHQAGRLALAEEIYRRILAAEPDQPDALHLLGVVAHQVGQSAVAVDYIARALTLRPSVGSYHCNLGEAYRALGRVAEAMDCYRRAVELAPDCIAAYNNMGNALRGQRRLDEAVDWYQRAVERKPDYADALNNLANALRELGRLDEAVACYGRATQIRPDHAEAYSNLGLALLDQQRTEEAVSCCRRAVQLQPGLAEAHNNLGNALHVRGDFDEAASCFRRALELQPNFAQAMSNLGNSLKDQAQLDEAIAWYRRAMAIVPDSAPAHSNLLYALCFSPGIGPRALYEEHHLWEQRHAGPLAGGLRPHANDRRPDRRLRIGYVSPDFRRHVVGFNLLPLFAEHDHEQFEVFAYDDAICPDHVTERLRGSADGWRRIFGLADDQVAEMAREDRIDILVDLTLHTARNRLLVFARKPAPVQVTFAGYPGSTGLSTIDYRLTDPYLDPPGLNDDYYSERSIRLPHSFWCYDPLSHEPPPSPLPALEAGMVTFGCLSNFGKTNPPVLRLWAQVLNRVAGSRLILLAAEGSHRQRALDLFAEQGVAPGRVSFVAHQPREEYLQVYHRIDLGLDTFPYNGHTTSLDSLWMGVPVITLVGQTAVGRAGLSQLTNLGLAELAADTPEQFVDIATELAKDLPRLANLRATLRDRMQNSPLMDAPGFARNIEAAYRTMWQRWCAGITERMKDEG